MDVAIGAALVGAACGPALARAVYQQSVEFGAQPRTACRLCGEPLSTSPVARLGWLGKCRACGRHLGPRVWLVTVAAAVAGALAGHRVGDDPSAVVFMVFAVLCVLLAFVDVAVRRLPDALTVPLAVLGVVGLGTASYLARDATSFLRGLIAAALAGGFFLALAWFRPDGTGMGLGDAKLASVLGLYLGWLGWQDLMLGFFAGTLVGALFAVALVATGRADRKASIPYGPFLLLGAAVALLLG
jgi:leader peptidase (prepilin peptidase)/N-methyltransferase